MFRSLVPTLAESRTERLFDLDRWFDDAFFGPLTQPRAYAPAMDVRETKDAYHVRVEVPGLAIEDLKLELENDTLSIRGEKREEKKDTDGFTWSETRWGSFQRHVRLDAPVEASRVAANLRNGVLTIVLPKSEAAKPRTIPIQAGPESAAASPPPPRAIECSTASSAGSAEACAEKVKT